MSKEMRDDSNFSRKTDEVTSNGFSAQIATAGQNSADAVVNNKIVPMLLNNNSQSISAVALCYLSFLTACMYSEKKNIIENSLEERLNKFENILISLIETEKENQKELIEAIKNINYEKTEK